MKRWTTTIKAINPLTGELAEWCGPNIEAPSRGLAHEYCQSNGLGYCFVDSELIMEIGTKDGLTPDWNNVIDYTLEQNN